MNSEKGTLNPQQWLSMYGDYLFSLAMYRVGHKEISEDLVQETFVSAMKTKDSFRGDSSEKTWLVTILKNKIIDHYRKKDVLKDTTSYLQETEDGFSEHFFERGNGHWLAAAAPKQWTTYADSALTEKEFYKILHTCIQKLPSSLIPVFIMKFIEEEDSETICKVYNISSSNYWVIIHRAKVLVRSCLEKNWFLK
jgi:RNA polymerase sigma-70 factor (TIGR02943 family)